jgi:hypothetical protein
VNHEVPEHAAEVVSTQLGLPVVTPHFYIEKLADKNAVY